MAWVSRLLASLRKNKLEDQLDDELQLHIEMRTQEFHRGWHDSDGGPIPRAATIRQPTAAQREDSGHGHLPLD